MSLAHRAAQAVSLFRRRDQVDMIGHQAIGPNRDARLARLFGQEIAVDLVIAILEEDRFTPIPPLSDMVREAGDDRAGEARHSGNVT